MNVHKNARLTPHGRERIVRQVESEQTPKAVGEAAGVCPRTVRKWVSRYRSEGLAGLRDRSSRPHRLHRPTPQAVVAAVERILVMENDTVADLDAAVCRYLDETGARPRAAMLAIAGPIDGEEVALTNRAWRFRRGEFAHRFGFSQLRIVNDFAAT